MKNLCECKEFTDFDVHPVCFQLGVSALGDGNPHEIQTDNYLILRESIKITHLLDVSADVQVGSYFLHFVFLIDNISQ